MPEKDVDSVGSTLRRELLAFKRIPDPVCSIGGVCAGVAYRLAIPTWIVRLTWFVLAFCYGFGFFPYILLWMFVPNADAVPRDYAARTGHAKS